jgi:hypothetical protein
LLFFLLIIGIPFVLGLLALLKPDLLEQAIRDPRGPTPPP